MTARRVVDPLTVAYVAMGAGETLRKMRAADKLPEAILDAYEGELGFVGAVIEHSLMLDKMADDADLFGCFAYEVAEPFGSQYAEHLILEPRADHGRAARELAKQLIAGVTV